MPVRNCDKNLTSVTQEKLKNRLRFIVWLAGFFFISFSLNGQSCAVTGDALVCSGEIVTYSVNLSGCSGNAAGYWWTVTGDGVISGSNIDPTVTVIWSGTGAGVVAVNVTGILGNITPLNVTIHVPPNPVITTDVDLACIGAGHGDPPAEPCFQVCEWSSSTFTVQNNPNSQYLWVVNGGYGSSTTNEITVNWYGSGNGSIQVTETNDAGCVTTITKCVIKVRKPSAMFSTVPYSNILGGQTINICLGQTIWFTNESFALASGPTITGVIWDFGDGTVLPAGINDNPSHTYLNPGPYTIVLTVTNQCNCSSSITLNVNVENDLWVDIECPTPVCANSLATYTTTAVCSTYVWNATNGNIITNPNSHTNTIQVQWGNGQNGPGTVSLQGINCNVNCNNVSSIQIPIFSNQVAIVGPNPSCSDAQTTYSVPLVPGSFYTWSVTPDPPVNIVHGQSTNQIVIDWNGYLGSATISCDYENNFLGCPPANTDLVADVRESFTVDGPLEICENLTIPAIYEAIFTYSGTTNFRFVLKNSAAINIQDWNNITSDIQISSWSYGIGLFTLEVYDLVNVFCSSPVTIQILVRPSPTSPATITGDDEICPGLTYSYSAPPLPSVNYNYNWTITGGTPTTGTGNPLMITWEYPYNPASQIVLSVTDQITGCQSESLTLPVQQIPVVPPQVEGPRKVCLNTISDYEIINWAAINCEKVEWTINPQVAGSIVTGQNTPNLSIQWNNAVTPNVTLKVTTWTCGVQDNWIINVNLNENTLSVPVTPNPVCEGVQANLNISSASTHSFPTNYQWTVESGTGFTSFASTSVPVQHAFSLNNHPNPIFNGSVIATYTDAGDPLSVRNCETGNFNVTVLSKPQVSILPSNAYVCPDPVVLDATSGFSSYLWNTGQTTSQITVSLPGMYTVTVTDASGCSGMNVIEIYDCPCTLNQNLPAPQYTYTVSDCVTKTVDFSVTGTYNPAYTYILNFGDGATQTITAFTPHPTTSHAYSFAGIYNVCISVIDPSPDPDHCNEWCDDVEIPISALFSWNISCPGVDPSMYTITFNNQTSSINPATFVWKKDGVQFSTDPNPVMQWSGGTYLIELTATSGTDQCIASETVVMPSVPVQPLFTISGAPFCEKQTPVVFDYTGGPASQIAAALWQFGDQTESKLFPHTERVFDNIGGNPYLNWLNIVDIYGCQFSYNEAIEIEENKLTGQLTATPNPFCQGGNANISYNIPLGSTTPTHYLWTNGQTSNPATVFTAGNYGVTVYDLGIGHTGCQNILVPYISVSEYYTPFPSFTGDLNLCLGEVLLLSGNYGQTFNYAWTSNPPFLSLSTATDPWEFELNTSSEIPGAYLITLTIEDLLSGCTRSYTDLINIYPIPDPPNISANPTTLCSGTSTVLDITNNPQPPGQYNVNWSTGASTNSINVIAANTYIATFTNPAGCTSSNQITINESPNLDWVIMGCYDFCNDEQVVIPGNPGITYQSWKWMVNGIVVDNDFGTPVSDLDLNAHYGLPLTPGIYTIQLVVTDFNNCTASSDPITITVRDCPCRIESVQSNLRCIGIDANNIAYYRFEFIVSYNFTISGNNIQLTSNDPCAGVSLDPVTNVTLLTGFITVNMGCSAEPKKICMVLTYNDPPDNSCVYPFCFELPSCFNPEPCEIVFDPVEVLCNGNDLAGNPVYTFNFDLTNVTNNYNVFFSSPHGTVIGFPTTISPGNGPYTGTITDTPPCTYPGAQHCIQMNVWSDNPAQPVCHQRHCFMLPQCGSGDPDRPFVQTDKPGISSKNKNTATFVLAPNPVSDHLEIKYILPEDANGILQIEDTRGKIYFTTSVTSIHQDINITVDNYPQGVYFVSLSGKKYNRIVKKLVILK
jgi:PKD repeat protein